MIKIVNPRDCCGCTACASICSHNAIKMKPDPLGFLYPVVDESKCNDCGLCEKVCSFHLDYNRAGLFDTPHVYGAYNKRPVVVKESQSGGLFFTIAERIISVGGVIYGAVFRNVTKVAHAKATTLQDLQLLRGSKYVQSDLGEIFSDVVKELRERKVVLFSGTGCQIAGLRSFIKTKRIDDQNLILCDIVCHGVPSPKVWEENVRYLEKKNGQRIVKANFRDKKLFGWHSSISSYVLENGKVITSDRYNLAFGFSYINRRSCDVCHFSNFKRPSDITLGDFWGLKSLKPSLDTENKGVSLVLVNSEKGQKIFESIQKEIIFFETNTLECQQPNLLKPTPPSPNRDAFEEIFLSKGYYAAIQNFPQLKIKSKIRIFTEKVIFKIKRIIK